ncbi:hAT transposon family protein [bacterium]|nr:hAT transposon family protein [bacterium]
MNTNIEISQIVPQTIEINMEEVVKERLRDLPYNSIIWSIADLYEIKGTTEPFEKLWTHPEIFSLGRQKENKKYQHSKLFKEIKEGEFKMKCLLCSFESKFFVSSKGCPEILEHAREKHSNIIGDTEIRQRDNYCTFKNCKEKIVLEKHAELMSFIITSFSPFRVLSNEHFIKFISLLDKNYTLPSRQTMSNVMIPTYLQKAKEIIQKEIDTNECVCISIDGWSSNFTFKKYFSFTVHYLYENKLKSAVLKLEHFKENHTDENIKDFIIKSIKEWNLEKFGSLFIMSDNAPDMLSGIRLSENRALGCSVHRLDKVIQKTIERMNVYKSLVKKVRNTCTKFRQNQTLANILDSVQEEEFGSSLKVLNAVDTRFFTELTMIKRFYEIRSELEGVIEAFASENGGEIEQFILSSFTFTENEYVLMKYFIDIFEIIYKKSESLSSDAFPTLSDLIPTIKSLHSWLKNKQQNINDDQMETSLISNNVTLTMDDVTYTSFIDFEEVQQVRNQYSISQQSYEDNIYSIKYNFLNNIISVLEEQFYIGSNNIMTNEDCLISTFINPKYMNKYFDDTQITTVIELVKNKCELLDEIQITQNQQTQSQTNNQFEDEDIMEYGVENMEEVKVDLTIDEEIEMYLKKEKVGKNADITFILSFWENNKNELKMLYKLARKYLVNLASSCSSERLFSMAGTYFEKRRTRMLGSTLESECILKSFIDNNGVNELI